MANIFSKVKKAIKVKRAFSSPRSVSKLSSAVSTKGSETKEGIAKSGATSSTSSISIIKSNSSKKRKRSSSKSSVQIEAENRKRNQDIAKKEFQKQAADKKVQEEAKRTQDILKTKQIQEKLSKDRAKRLDILKKQQSTRERERIIRQISLQKGKRVLTDKEREIISSVKPLETVETVIEHRAVIKDVAGEFALGAPRQIKNIGVSVKNFGARRFKALQKNYNLTPELAREVIQNPQVYVDKTSRAFVKAGNNINRISKGTDIPVLAIAASFLSSQADDFNKNPGEYLGGAFTNVVLEFAAGKIFADLIGVSKNVKRAAEQIDEIDGVITSYKKAGVNVRQKTTLAKELRDLEQTKRDVKKILKGVENKIDDVAKTKVTKNYKIKVKEKLSVPKKQLAIAEKKIKQAPPKKTQAQLKAELAKFEEARVAKTSKPSKKVKIISDDVKSLIEANTNDLAKLETMLESKFGTKEFKKLTKLVEERTGKKVLVRQTKRKIKVQKGSRIKEKTLTKVNIVDKKAAKILLKKGEKVKRIKVGELSIENLKEVKKASKEIAFKLEQGRITEVFKSITKWDKKGNLKLVSSHKRKSFTKQLKNKVRREISDAKDIYKVARNNYRKVLKQTKELSAKRRRKGFTSNLDKQLTKSKSNLRKAINAMLKSQDDLQRLKKILGKLPAITNALLKGLINLSSQDLAKALDNSQANDQLRDLAQAMAQDLKKAQEQFKAFEEIQTSDLKPKKPSEKKPSTRGRRVKKPIKLPIKELVPEFKGVRVKTVLKEPPIKPFIPKLSFSSKRLDNRVLNFQGLFRERKNPNNPFSNKNSIIVKRNFKNTKNRVLNSVYQLADTKLIVSGEIKVIGIGKSKRDVKLNVPLSRKFDSNRLKGSPALKFKEKSKYRLDSRTEKREIKKLRGLTKVNSSKPKKKTTKKKPIKKKTTKKKVLKRKKTINKL